MSTMFPEHSDDDGRVSRTVNEIVILAVVGLIVAALLLWSILK